MLILKLELNLLIHVVEENTNFATNFFHEVFLVEKYQSFGAGGSEEEVSFCVWLDIAPLLFIG